ncbi:hypothetical protein NHH73_15095 [Oxalobacteraceae bacterium OTU3CINTB1]|nr:hypothetical protein NHH73_15095 [Oxalobacteraceae bacterium OTU3CINTB1]
MRRTKTLKNELKLVYAKFEFIFPMDGSEILEISFRPNIELMLNDIDIFHDTTALSKLSKIDSPLEYAGILFFPMLGISATGLHNKDDLSVTAVAKRRFDRIIHNFLPYKASGLLSASSGTTEPSSRSRASRWGVTLASHRWPTR